MLDIEKTEEYYKHEIRDTLSKVRESFKNEQMYNYDLAESHYEIEKEFGSIEETNVSVEEITNLYNKALKLLEENEEADS